MVNFLTEPFHNLVNTTKPVYTLHTQYTHTGTHSIIRPQEIHKRAYKDVLNWYGRTIEALFYYHYDIKARSYLVYIIYNTI